MGWKNLPSWVKGGLVLSSIFILLVIFFTIVDPDSWTFLALPVILFIYFVAEDFLKDLGIRFTETYWFFITLFLSLFFYFILGAIIGFIIGKIKNRNKEA